MSAQKRAGGGSSKGQGNGKAKKAASKVTKRDEDDTEWALQAVILADDFDTRFRPFTEEKPRCLLPLANTPLIDYTLEWLAMSGVSGVYIYPGADTVDEVEAYIRKSKWNPESNASAFETVEVIVSKATSIGDAMRDLDRRKVIHGDFLVVHGDLVCNISIADALAKHKSRRKFTDKNAIMTMLLGSGDQGDQRAKKPSTTPVFVLDRLGRCMHYEEMDPLQEDKHLRIPAEVLSSCADIEIRSDLVDYGIDICTPDVLALWSDEFDYQQPRKQFLHGVLKDYELNGKTIYTTRVRTTTTDYARRVNSLQAYADVSKDVLGRWSHHVVPEINVIEGQSYQYTPGGVIKEGGVIISRGSRLGETVVGNETSIGDGANIKSSTIGRRCQIGKNVTIQNAYIWDDVTIGDGAHIAQSIIGSEAVIGNNTKVSGGTVISFGVKIADGVVADKGFRITRGNRQRTNSNPSDAAIVGEDGSGYIFIDEDEPEDEIQEEFLKQQNSLFYSMPNLSLSSDSISTISSEVSGPISSANSRRLSSGSFMSDDDTGFHHDAVQGLYDTLQEHGDFDSAKLEFMGLRLSNNASDKQIRHSIAVAFTKNMITLITEDKLDAMKAVKKSLDTRAAVTFLKEVAIGRAKEVDSQSEFLLEVQKSLCAKSSGPEILPAFCMELYERDVVEEEGFEAWWVDDRGKESEELTAVRGKTEKFITWLREADEEDSDEEEESGEESD